MHHVAARWRHSTSTGVDAGGSLRRRKLLPVGRGDRARPTNGNDHNACPPSLRSCRRRRAAPTSTAWHNCGFYTEPAAQTQTAPCTRWSTARSGSPTRRTWPPTSARHAIQAAARGRYVTWLAAPYPEPAEPDRVDRVDPPARGRHDGPIPTVAEFLLELHRSSSPATAPEAGACAATARFGSAPDDPDGELRRRSWSQVALTVQRHTSSRASWMAPLLADSRAPLAMTSAPLSNRRRC